jgi:NAD(P)-dependent dehydrogenase (short-subunit alcohol dehydrogenase family)
LLAERGRIHTLVNNSGISRIGKLEATTGQDFDRVFESECKRLL